MTSNDEIYYEHTIDGWQVFRRIDDGTCEYKALLGTYDTKGKAQNGVIYWTGYVAGYQAAFMGQTVTDARNALCDALRVIGLSCPQFPSPTHTWTTMLNVGQRALAALNAARGRDPDPADA